MPEKTLSNLHVRSWECSPAQGDGETPARRMAGQTAEVRDSFEQGAQYFGTESATSFVKWTASSDTEYNGSRSITSQLRLTRTEIPGVAMTFSLSQRQMPKIFKKKKQIWKLKRECVCLKHPSIIFGSSASQTSLQRGLLIITPTISADARKMCHIISVSASTAGSKCDPGSLPQALRNSCYVWLPPRPPCTKTAHFHSLNLELFTAVEAQTETTGHLSSHPSRMCRDCPNERGLHPSAPATLPRVSSGKLLPSRTMPFSPTPFPRPAENQFISAIRTLNRHHLLKITFIKANVRT